MRTHRRGTLSFIPLEDRTAPAVFTVTTTADNGNNVTPTVGSLRAAIVAANAAAGADTINFAIAGGGVQTILPSTQMVAITDPVTIDGTTQTGYSGTPVIRISGANAAAGSDGLVLLNHTGSTIKGLNIAGFGGGVGIRINGGGQHLVQNNLIGTNQTGTAAEANGVGIVVTGASVQNVIGGGQDKRNIISGNTNQGILLNSASSQNTITSNFIGVALNGATPLANGGDGILISAGAAFTTVGGTAAGGGNIIASNGGAGVHVTDPATAGTQIQGNRIGLDFAGTASPNGGDGVRVENAAGTAPVSGLAFPTTNTTISSNTIRSNKGNGVSVLDTSRYVRILSNTISNNGGLGISVDATANDGLAAPVLTNLQTDSNNGITVTGTIVGRTNTAYVVSIYGNSTADASGFGEGETAITTVTVTTDAGGNATFTVKISAGLSTPFVSATATASTAGDTSAFAATQARPSAGLDASIAFVAAGSGAPTVAFVNQVGGTVSSINVFDASFTGGVRVAAADFNADGIPEVIAGTGPGTTTLVRVIDPVTQKQLFSVQPFEAAFTGGVYVSAGDVTGDGVPDVIISPDEGGGPRVRVFSGKDFSLVADFFGIADPNFRGGARTAVGDVNKDGTGDLVVAAGFGGGPRVAVFNGKTVTSGTPTTLFNDFFAFEQTLRNGVFIAAGDINDDGFAEIIAGGGPGGGPRVLALNGQSLLSNQQVPAANFFAGDTATRGGIRVASRDLNADGNFEIITGDGPGAGGKLRVYTGSDFAQSATPDPRVEVDAFPSAAGGVFVG
ncbi:beta strand repeat-containing protein [Limnoglobus roseus]|uniref:Right handed beta helix domain-containing protein n=1 Tax=Limnoglobus roseus TaxID=2598579 RepID=A0A5C1A9P4_9BACT|nr:right-handed parallel beta-helix repeat-containing protein [Limnoglobus roseus]QEL14532.1 hypothetical protein PX52LOC_01422 [Limnoglobus roseus]